MKVLASGGAGYIGSVRVSSRGAGFFYEGDIADRKLIQKVVAEHPEIQCTVHMAARTVVPESVTRPYEYYRDNVTRSLELFNELVQLDRPRVIFPRQPRSTPRRTTSKSLRIRHLIP
jgi:UDP-glucose 4-epimerase